MGEAGLRDHVQALTALCAIMWQQPPTLEDVPNETGVIVLDVRDPGMRELRGKIVRKINGLTVTGRTFDDVKLLLTQRPIVVLFASQDGTQDTEMRFEMGDNLGLRISQAEPSPTGSRPPPVMGADHLQSTSSCCASDSFWHCSRHEEEDD